MEWMREPGFIVGTSIGIVGVVLAIYQVLTVHQRKEPVWAIDNTYLIRGLQSQLSDLRVLYHDHPVTQLTVSRIAFWNAGSEPIRMADLIEGSPLRIESARGVDILDISIIATNRTSNEFKLIHEDSRPGYIPMRFVHLDKDNGAVMQVIHTGQRRDAIKVEGDTIGVKRLRHLDIQAYSARRKKLYLRMTATMTGAFIIATAITVSNRYLGLPLFDSGEQSLWDWTLLVGLFSVTLLIVWLPVFRSRVPRGLEAFHDDPFDGPGPQPVADDVSTFRWTSLFG